MTRIRRISTYTQISRSLSYWFESNFQWGYGRLSVFRNGYQMNYSDLSSKLTQVIEQIPKDALYDFCCSYAQEHEELAMALVNEFWRPEKDDYRSMVQQCLMHPTPAGVKNGDGCSFISLAQRKGTKETSTLTKASPYMERMQLTMGRNRPASRFW